MTPHLDSSRTTARRLLAVGLLLAGTWALLELLAAKLFAVSPTLGLHVALGTIGFEIASGTLALWLSRGPSLPPRLGPPAQLSVLVAAYNEAAGIVSTVRSIRTQTEVELEVIVADDGSDDATSAALIAAFDLRPFENDLRSPDGAVTLLALPHRGKGAALNAATAAARFPLIATVDADTLLAPLALARLATAFEDPRVGAATGSVLVARTPSLLTRFQQIEYVRNTLIRVAWAGIDALEQLPGAFMAVRTDWLRAAGGYPTHSLTEDYELVYRLYDRAARDRLPFRVAAVPTACAYTDAPRTLGPLLRQRSRWFAGFLTTLARFRHLIGSRRAGVFGVVKLPIKVIDAIHPPLSLFSLVIVLADTRFLALRPLALSLFWLHWAWDSFTLAMAVRFARRAGAEIDLGRAQSAWPWIFVLADGVSYFWLRQIAVLRAYVWALRPPVSWKPVREAIPDRTRLIAETQPRSYETARRGSAPDPVIALVRD